MTEGAASRLELVWHTTPPTGLRDVWHEEYEERLQRYDGAEGLAADPDEHGVHIPEGHFWEDVRQKTTDIGAALNQALHAIVAGG